jgi:uncharacterized protein
VKSAAIRLVACGIAMLLVPRSSAHTSQTAAVPAAGYPIRAVPSTAVQLTDGFWRPRLEINRTVTIPHIMRENEQTGRVDNFLKAAHKVEGPYQGQRYNDTDVYKIIEAASYSLKIAPDPALDKKLDALIAIVAAAQEADGYLYTPRSVDPKNPAPGAGPERWSWLGTSHELYDQGHMYEAAVAHFEATGKRTLLNVAIKSADLVCKVFGPNARHDVPGHEEIELALVKLSRATGDRKYLDEAKFFLDERGRPHTNPPITFEPGSRFAIYNDLAYRQDQEPVVAQTQAVGHAVRATYLYSAMTDVAALLHDAPFGHTVDALWRDVASKRMYLTGGLGAEARTEAFGADYVLPNRAYAETCASVGGMLWYHRMFLREGDAAYYDTFERTLYNGYLSGVSLSGDRFFYQNPLVSNGTIERSAYFDVACCPANLSRLMEQIPGLIYAQRDNELYVNLFVGSTAAVNVGGASAHVTQDTEYPWDGRVTIHVDPDRPADFTLDVRIPGWSRGEAMPTDLYRFADVGNVRLKPDATSGAADVRLKPDATSGATSGAHVPSGFSRTSPTLSINGKPVALTLDKGFARLHRVWRKGDVIVLDLPMPIRRVLAHDRVAEDRGRAAIQRGPIVYCLEAVDNSSAGEHIGDIRLPLDAPLAHTFKANVLGGVEVITGGHLVAVPYYAWNNRGKGEMAVWIPYE